MAPWENILCCSELNYLPHNPRHAYIPPTTESVKHLDFILLQGHQPASKDDPKAPLMFNDYKNHKGIVSVVRFGDVSDKHWPVRYFAAKTKEDGTLGGFVEVSEEKVNTAEIQSMVGGFNKLQYDRYYGECPNHPNLEFYVRFHALKEKPMFSWEEDPKEKNKNYPWEEGARVTKVPKLKPPRGRFDFDSDDCPLPVMFDFPTGVITTTDWQPVKSKDDWITDFDSGWIPKIDLHTWPTMVGRASLPANV